MHGGEPTAPEHETLMYYGDQFSRGHFNQHTAVTGTSWWATRSSRSTATAGATTVGPRYWQAIWAYRLFIANFGEDRALMILKNIRADGTSRRRGVLLVDGEYHEVTDLDVWTEWDDNQEPAAAARGPHGAGHGRHRRQDPHARAPAQPPSYRGRDGAAVAGRGGVQRVHVGRPHRLRDHGVHRAGRGRRGGRVPL
ncbi:hypothetical protein ACFQV8_23970 [Pseudonocardia benzenivorans]